MKNKDIYIKFLSLIIFFIVAMSINVITVNATEITSSTAEEHRRQHVLILYIVQVVLRHIIILIVMFVVNVSHERNIQ